MKTKQSVVVGIVVIIALVLIVAWISRPAPAQVTPINIPATIYPTVPPSAPAYTITVASVGDSGVAGTATFEDISGSLDIHLRIGGLPGEEEGETVSPSEVRLGTCADPGAVAYAVAAPDAGESETELGINLEQFNALKPMALFLYRSGEDHTVIACGDIP